MRLLTALAFVAGIGGSVALAQATSPAPPDAQSLAPDPSQMKAKELRAHCREEGRAQGLKGQELKASIEACFAKARPDLAAARACRKQGKDQGLGGPDLKAFVKQCKRGGQ